MGSFGTPTILGASREDRLKKITFSVAGSASYATGGDTLALTAAALVSNPFGMVRVDGVKLVGVPTGGAANSKYSATYIRDTAGAAATGKIKLTNVEIVDAVGHTHTPTPVIESDYVFFVDPDAADLVSVVTAVDAANGVLAIALQPDYPRHLQVRVTNAGVAITAGVVTLVGIGAGGEAVGQVIALTGGTATTITTDVYARLTSATITAFAGGGAGETIGIGVGAGLGLPKPKALGATVFAVYKTVVDTADEAPGAVNATAGSVAPTSAANAARDFHVWFNRTVTPIATASALTGAAAPAEVANATNLAAVTFIFEATGE